MLSEELDMLLYHYNTKPLPKLLCGRLIKPIDPQVERMKTEFNEQTNGPGIYPDHISFFADPIPLNLGSLYSKFKHHTWIKGNVLYQHVIETTGLEFGFEVVETPDHVEYMRKYWKNEYADDANLDQYIAYHLGLNKMALKKGLQVNERKINTAALLKATAPYRGKLLDYYQQSIKESNPILLSKQYATAVPHVLMYPKSGYIELHQSPIPITLE